LSSSLHRGFGAPSVEGVPTGRCYPPKYSRLAAWRRFLRVCFGAGEAVPLVAGYFLWLPLCCLARFFVGSLVLGRFRQLLQTSKLSAATKPSPKAVMAKEFRVLKAKTKPMKDSPMMVTLSMSSQRAGFIFGARRRTSLVFSVILIYVLSIVLLSYITQHNCL